MDTHWIWWFAAVIVVMAELATGTVYLLMLALGLVAGGVAALLTLGMSLQLLAAAVGTALGCAAVHRKKSLDPPKLQAQRNADVHIDLGNEVQVDAWAEDHTATVNYRGARWQVAFDGALTALPVAGKHRIVAMNGSTLVLAPL